MLKLKRTTPVHVVSAGTRTDELNVKISLRTLKYEGKPQKSKANLIRGECWMLLKRKKKARYMKTKSSFLKAEDG